MEFWTYFYKGAFVGFVIAAPVGPVGIMCIHRTICQGKVAGYLSGLGAALADTFFGAIAAFGFGFIAGPLIDHNNWLRFVGGVVLCLIGLRSLLSRKLPAPATRDRKDLIGDFVSAFLVTLTNPITIISFAAIYAAMNIPHLADHLRWGLALTSGVFIGAAVWWLLLTIVAGAFHGRVAQHGVLWINRISGAIILVFGILLLISLLSYDSNSIERKLQERGVGALSIERPPVADD
jgi:threonine/homoserine/homoserine lactone efflux protein